MHDILMKTIGRVVIIITVGFSTIDKYTDTV